MTVVVTPLNVLDPLVEEQMVLTRGCQQGRDGQCLVRYYNGHRGTTLDQWSFSFTRTEGVYPLDIIHLGAARRATSWPLIHTVSWCFTLFHTDSPLVQGE